MSGGHNLVFKEPGLRKWADNFAFGVMIGRCVVQLHFVCLTLFGRVRYPLCRGCRCRPMQPMASRQHAPKGLRCNGSGGLYGGDVGILYGPDIAVDAFRFLYRKPDGLDPLAHKRGRAYKQLCVS